MKSHGVKGRKLLELEKQRNSTNGNNMEDSTNVKDMEDSISVEDVEDVEDCTSDETDDDI